MDQHIHPDVKRVIFSAEAVSHRVREMAELINKDYAHTKELVVIGILKGAFVFLSDLLRCITVPTSVEFMSLSSYGSSTQSSGVVRILMDLKSSIEGKDVLIVEDIVDTGLTMNYLLGLFGARNPNSISVAVLLRKPASLKVDVPVKYIGFDIPQVFVVGYGLDYAERYRGIPYLGELKEEVYNKK